MTGSGLSAFRGADGEFATPLPAQGDAYLRVQRAGAADSAVALGATVRLAQDGLIIADSPGGFMFCLVKWHGEARVPALVPFGHAGRSRADQLCLDIPAAGFERECSRVTGHVDFACADRHRLAAAHTAAGARIVAESGFWTVLADPTGRAYCLNDDQL